MSSRKRTLRTARALGALFSLGIFAACGSGEGGELEVTNIDPRAGATAGEQAVMIRGNHFRPDIGYTVYFGTKRAERATVLDENTLVVATPGAEQPGAVDIIVASDTGPAYRIVRGFRYEDMSGNVMENVGSATSGQGEERF